MTRTRTSADVPRAAGGLWVAEQTRIRRLVGGQWTEVLARPPEFQEAVVCLKEDSRGHLWVGGYKLGVLVFMKDGGVLRCTKDDGLENNATLCIFEDRDGQIWIGSNGGGVARLRPRSATTYDEHDGLAQPIINSIAEISAGLLLVGLMARASHL